MKIGIFHGYELSGSGSNQATQYLARALVQEGHEIHILCREPNPTAFNFLDKAIRWDNSGRSEVIFEKRVNSPGSCMLHQLPLPPINAVYITDTQRPGNVKAFSEMTEAEIQDYHRFVVSSLRYVLKTYPVDILHNNHLVYQPVAAAEVCSDLGIPYIIYPRGSAIEYTIRHDDRFKELAREPLLRADGLMVGNTEVRDRILNLYPDHRKAILAKTEIVGLGVDTSLFIPVKRKHRMQSIETIYGFAPFAGKSPELTQELYTRLDAGDIQAITDYREVYQIKQPDSNLIEKLKKVSWKDNILVFVGATIVGKGLQAIIVALPFILKQFPNTHFVIIGSGVSRELFEALVYAITSKNETLLDMLVTHGYDFDPVQLSGPWSDVQTFLSDPNHKKRLFVNGETLMNHVHFLGRLDHELLRYVFPCADIGFFPSIVPEAYANVLFESLANGVFPMASYFSGLACGLDSLVSILGQDLVDMMKIPVDDNTRIPGLIDCLSRFLSLNNREAVSAKLRRAAVDHFDWQIRAKQMVAAYSGYIHNLRD